MKRLKVKFNYGGEFRVFDVTLSIIDQLRGTGFVIALGQLELERYVFLAPGCYLAQVIYDLPDSKGTGKKTCLLECQFDSEEIERLSINFKKPTTVLSGFTQPELNDLEGILKATIGGRLNLRPEQTFAVNTVRELGPATSLEERVVIDKNGKVEYELSYNEQQLYENLSPEEQGLKVEPTPQAPPEEDDAAERILFSHSPTEAEQPSPRPYALHALNYGYWNIGLYGLNSNIGAREQGYRKVRSLAYLRPRVELFNRLPSFITENMEIARLVNNLSGK